MGQSNQDARRSHVRAQRSRRGPIAALWLVAASGFGVLVLWVSGYEPWEWWKAHETAAAAKAVPPRAAPGGAISIVQPTPLGTDSSISRVPLPLHLTATRLGRNSREGYADIGVNVVSPQTYKAGALLANGARLEEIYADHVVLEREHRRTPLYIEGHIPPAGAEPAVASLLAVGGTTPIPRAVADSRDTLTEVVRIAPVFEGDQLRALQLYPSAQSDLYTGLGLEPGDQVVAIEGAALRESRQAIAELRRLTTGASLTVTIERRGKRQTISLDGSVLVSGERG